MSQATKEDLLRRDWTLPGSPKPQKRGRECEVPLSKCATAKQTGERGKVNMFATKVGGFLLCEACRRKCSKKGITPRKLVGKPKTRGSNMGPKKSGYPLPRLREIREAKGLSRRELAAGSECSHKSIEKWERDTAEPSAAVSHRMAQVLGVNVSELRGFE